MRSKKDLVGICQQIGERILVEKKPDLFFLDDRLQVIREIVANLEPYAKFDQRKESILILCAKILDVYRAEPEINFSISTGGIDRVPKWMLEIFDDQFNWREIDMIGRNLSALRAPAGKVTHSFRAILFLADIGFILLGPEKYEDAIKKHPFASDEFEFIIKQAFIIFDILKEYVNQRYYANMLERFGQSFEYLKERDYGAWAYVTNNTKFLRSKIELSV